MSHVADLLQIVSSFDMGWVVAVLLLIVVIYFIRDRYEDYSHNIKLDIDRHKEIIEKIDQAISSRDGDVIDLHTHHDMLSRLALDIGSQCERCVEHRRDVRTMHAQIDELVEKIDQFLTESKEYRAVMRDSTELSVQKLDSLTNQVIDTLCRALDLGKR